VRNEKCCQEHERIERSDLQEGGKKIKEHKTMGEPTGLGKVVETQEKKHTGEGGWMV